MNGILQLIGFIMNSVGLICVLVTTFVPEWRRNDPAGEVLESIVRHQGIWVRCIAYPTGQWQCDDYDAFFLGLPMQLQVARGLSVTACILGFMGFIVSLVGMQCTNCFEGNPRMKARTSMVGAIAFGLSGISIGAAVSFYAHQVLSEYNRDILLFRDDIGQRFIYGVCLFVGWASIAILVLGALVSGCGSLVDDEEDSVRRTPYMPTYNKGKNMANTEYV
ncbi:claudin-7-like [Styela clava]|uniref:claudin-7-like n=1 Tax=Styela clava TaxID=7725 RepID=UPI00193AB7EE|nr:claudin-7-like [Styela clava]